MSTELAALTLEEASRLVHGRSVSPSELVRACLTRIEAHQPALGAFITVTADAALAAAEQAQRELAQGMDRGPLHGIPIALKDLYETAGVRTTAGSKILAGYVPTTDAHAVTLLRDAGAVLIGKTNLHEWAFGVTNDNPHFGPTRNPWDLARIPGGSSGGSGAALAAGMCYGSLGSDTGGSIRIPASLCGVVGLKPTYGRVSLRGVIPLAWTLDHAGPMARGVRDVALLLAAIAGHDPADPGSAEVAVGDYLGAIEGGVAGMSLALPANFFFERVDAEIARAAREAAAVLSSLGARIEEVTIPRAEEIPLAQGTIISADAAAYHRAHLADHREDIGADVLERLRRGERTSALDYAAARRTQAELRREMELALSSHDALLTPTTPIAAPRREGQKAVEAAARLTALTAPFNLSGLPAISVPCGFTAGGLPIGLQIVGGPWREATVLRVARAYERATDWRARTAPLR